MCEVHGLICNNIKIAIVGIYGRKSFVLFCCTNVDTLFTISKCFSLPTALLTFSNPLTRVEGDEMLWYLTGWKEVWD